MLPLPARFAGIILAFAPLFVHRSWRHAQPLLIGTIPTPGRRTVTSDRRILGRAQERRFVNVHRILSRAAWCPRSGIRIPLGMLISTFAPRGPVILALDDTIERRRALIQIVALQEPVEIVTDRSSQLGPPHAQPNAILQRCEFPLPGQQRTRPGRHRHRQASALTDGQRTTSRLETQL